MDVAASNVHNWSGYWPIVRIGETTLFPSYFLITSIAFCVCLVWLVRRAEDQHFGRNLILDLSVVIMVAGFIGARAAHVLFEEPRYYAEDPLRILEVWRGGFVWYGGAILGALTGLAFGRWRKLDLTRGLDLFAPVAALGYALGRVACLLTGCCYGRVCILESGFAFRYPTQAFAVVWELAVLFVLLKLEKGPRLFWLRPAGSIFFLWVILHSLGRLIMEAFRADPRGPAPAGLSLSTWISLLLIVLASAIQVRRARLEKNDRIRL